MPREKISSYGIIKGSEIEPDIFSIEDIIEKPAPDLAPSNLGAVGRYIFIPEIFDCLKRTSPGVGNEIRLTDAISFPTPGDVRFRQSKISGIKYTCQLRQGLTGLTPVRFFNDILNGKYIWFNNPIL